MRICMSLPEEVVKDLDKVLKRKGYKIRSKGITDALIEYVIRHQSEN